MATTKKRPALLGGQSANKEAAARYGADLEQRQRASRVLLPHEVAGEYDAGRMLSTTLGGVLRPMTHADLTTFRANVKTAGARFRGGITAKAVIDLSLPEDRERANREIRTAVPVQFLNGKIHFQTNAGPDSNVTRHHVVVELLNYAAVLASPAQAKALAAPLTTGPLKFDCDCGRHRYWYRYIATVGRYNAGRPETGFPKIRNPDLAGVACKHVLRVMQQLAMPIVRGLVAQRIEKDRVALTPGVSRLSKSEAQRLAEEQAKQQNWKRAQVETSQEKRERLAQARAVTGIAGRSAEKVAALPAEKIATTKRRFEATARQLAALGVLKPKQLEAMLAKVQGK